MVILEGRELHYEKLLIGRKKEKDLLYQTLEEFEKRRFTKAQVANFQYLLKLAVDASNDEGLFTAYRSEDE